MRLHAGLLVYILYAVVQCMVLQPEPYYRVYDTDNWARARWFLLKRLRLAPDQSTEFTPGAGLAVFNSTHISNVPGGANRWRLPQDSSGEAAVHHTHLQCKSACRRNELGFDLTTKRWIAGK